MFRLAGMSSFDEIDAFDGASLSARAMAARPQPYLEGLNPEQRAAVLALEGPVLMLAGAGTGKTKALTARIAHLLNTGTARPNEVLAVTFTNKAAREMKNRVSAAMGQSIEGMPWLGTFHSICVKLLRRHAELAGLKSNFTILDTDDQIRLLKQLLTATNIDDKRWPARMLLDHRQLEKSGLDPRQGAGRRGGRIQQSRGRAIPAISDPIARIECGRFWRSSVACGHHLSDP